MRWPRPSRCGDTWRWRRTCAPLNSSGTTSAPTPKRNSRGGLRPATPLARIASGATPDPHGLLAYYTEIASTTNLGVLPYARDAAAFTPDLLEQLARTLPNLVGFKDGRGDVRRFQRIREHVVDRLGAERLVWLAGVGDDLVGAYFAGGAEGFTSSLACFWPEASAELYRLASSGDYEGLRLYHARNVRPFYELLQRGRGFEVSVIRAAMELLGHPAGRPRPPLGQLSDKDSADLRAILERLAVPTAADRTRAPIATG